MLAIILVSVLTICYSLYLYLYKKDYRLKLSKLKSEPSLPFVGHSHRLGRTRHDLMPSLEKMWIKFGRDKFLLKLGPNDHAIITNPKDVEAILLTHRLLDKNIMYKQIVKFVGDGILTVESSKWHTLRKVLTPAFYTQMAESFENIYQDEADILVKQIGKTPNDVDFDFLDAFMKTVLATIIKAVIGRDIGLGEDTEYRNVIMKLVSITNERMFSAWKSIDFLYNLTPDGKMFKKMIKYIKKKNLDVILMKREKLEHLMTDINSGKQTLESMTEDENFVKNRYGLLDLLLLGRKGNGEPLTNDEIIKEVLTFTLAGVETTSVVSAFTIYNLANNPDIQDKVIEEQRSITNNDLSKPVTVKELKEMKYLEAVIKETMRLNNPIVFFGRHVTEDVALPDGTVLPAGVNILFFPYFVHRHPDYFKDSETFDPSRFIDSIPAPFTYYPFSLGVRDCIGKKYGMIIIKHFVASLVRSFEFRPPKGPGPNVLVELALKSSTGVVARWQKREQ